MKVATEARIDLAVTPEQAFDWLAVRWFEHLRLWRPKLIEVTPLDEGVMRVGARGVEVRREKVGKSRQAVGRTFEVVRFEAPSLLVLAGEDSRPLRDLYRSEFRFEPLGTRTRLWWRFEQQFENPAFFLAMPLSAALQTFDQRRGLKALRAAIEGR